MKIAVTSVGRGLVDRVDERFGRCHYFVVVDTVTREVDAVENEAAREGSGAGVGAARRLIEHGADAVLTGRCGPNAFRALEAAKIAVYTGADGTVIEAVERLVADGLKGVVE